MVRFVVKQTVWCFAP